MFKWHSYPLTMYSSVNDTQCAKRFWQLNGGALLAIVLINAGNGLGLNVSCEVSPSAVLTASGSQSHMLLPSQSQHRHRHAKTQHLFHLAAAAAEDRRCSGSSGGRQLNMSCNLQPLIKTQPSFHTDYPPNLWCFFWLTCARLCFLLFLVKLNRVCLILDQGQEVRLPEAVIRNIQKLGSSSSTMSCTLCPSPSLWSNYPNPPGLILK